MNPSHQAVSIQEALYHATHPATVQAILNRDWAYTRNRYLHVAACKIHRVFPYKAGQYVIKYELLLDDGQQTYIQPAFGELVQENVSAYQQKVMTKLRKSRRGQLDRKQDTDRIAAIPSLGMLLRLPGLDEKLPGLILAHNPEQAQRHLSSLLGDGQAASFRTRILNHRLGKRCILRAEQESAGSSANSVILRCLRQHDSKHRYNHEVMQALWERGFNTNAADHIRIPRPLGINDPLATLLLEDVPGEMLGETERWSLARQAALAGATLGKLHSTHLPVDKAYSAREEIVMLNDWTLLTAQLRSELAPQLLNAFWQVRQQLEDLPEIAPVLAHRDFYGKQILHDGNQTVLIDFDTLCHADPALDIGNYLAHREFARIQGEAYNPLENRLFLEAYAEKSHLPALPRIHAWTQATLLRLACLYALNTDCQHLIPDMLEEINQ